MISPETVSIIRRKYEAIKPDLNERSRRHWVASEAMVLGHGGIKAVSNATGIAVSTIRKGLKELKAPIEPSQGRVRKEGGGRKGITHHDPTIAAALESIVEPHTRGDPESPLLWTSKSTRAMANELGRLNHKISHTKVGQLLRSIGYSLQSNNKSIEGTSHPDRNLQFEHISTKARAFMHGMQPVISVDTKKRELVGNFKNKGQEWSPRGRPEQVRVHDFEIPELGKASPYGIYDIANNIGWVNVGIDNDTASFAVESIRRWWNSMGKGAYRDAKKLMVTADCGGSNGYRVRLWKRELQKLADQTGLEIHVCHYPPGTSKWNKIEHRLFSFISQNWRGKPLISHAVIVNLIGATATSKGLKVRCELDTNRYPKGIKVSDEEMAKLNIRRDRFHGEWNYVILPRRK